MSNLVQRLSEGTHPVELSLRPVRNREALKECIKRGYVHVKFTGTRGGTELGVSLDKDSIDRSNADVENGSEEITLIGNLTLDYVKVRCRATINLSTYDGHGCLERVE